MKRLVKLAFIILLFSQSSCSIIVDASNAVKDSLFTYEDVKPWERGTLAEQDMQLSDDGMMIYADDHIYFSKEAATGGKGVGGGGCGCN